VRARLAAALLLAAAPASAAVEYTGDWGKFESSASELAFDVTVDPGEGRYLLMAIGMEGSAAVRAASLGERPLGFIGRASSPGGHCQVEWWGLVDPPLGMAPFQVELTAPASLVEAHAIAYRGVAGLGAFAVSPPAAGSDGPTAVTLASAPGEVVLDAVCGWSDQSVIDAAGPDQEARWHWSSGSMSSAGSEKPGASSVTMTWTGSGPGTLEWAAAGVALRTAGGHVAVRLNVETPGCATGHTPGGAFPMLGLVLVMAFALRRGAGTSAERSRGTSSSMRLHASRPAAAPGPIPEPELDAVTLARAKAGDRRAQAAIVERYQRPVFSLLWRMVGPQPAVVEDLTQETFLRVLRALERFEDDGRARMVTWVLSIASRLAIDHLRSCRPHRDVTIVPGALPVAMPTPEHEVNRRALGAALIRAVEGLSPQFRAAFLLREVHGLSYDEISLALEIDVGTVKSRLARARAALQAALLEMRDV
jgi:RNA polymerase sigma-70 factor (ECF subfamily)